MLYGWTEKQLNDAIDRCTKDIAGMVERHEAQEIIYGKRKLLKMLEDMRDKERDKNGN